MRRIERSPNLGRPLTLAAMGDSITEGYGWGVLQSRSWPELLAAALRDLDVPIKARNFGKSGNHTGTGTPAGMQGRFAAMTDFDIPTIGIVWGGINDAGNGITTTETQANTQTMAESLFDSGVTYVLVGNTQYLNWTTGGDAVDTPYASRVDLRAKQAAAVDAVEADHPGKVALADVYGYMRGLIVDGTDTQGSNSWHAYPDNQHLNAYGMQVVADAMLATIQAQSGWVAALQRAGR